MFETSVIHAEVVAEKRVGLLSASFAFHALVVIAILANGIRTIEFPTSAPKEYTIPVFALPPAGSPRPRRAQRRPQTVHATRAGEADDSGGEHCAEHGARSHRAVGSATTSTGDPNATSNDTGSDQPQGVPWGVPHGVGVDGRLRPRPLPPNPMCRCPSAAT